MKEKKPMQQFSDDILNELLAAHEAPCVSLYQPTHRHHPGTAEDPIRFRNLLKQIDESLRRKYAGREVKSLLGNLRSYDGDRPFWNHQLDGLAFFASADAFHVVQLQRPVRPLAVVADSFHLKPLVRIMQSADRYQVLCVSRGRVALYEGNRYALDEVDLQGVPGDLIDALGDELTEPHQTVASYNGASPPAMHHGHGGKADEDEINLMRYLRAVDRAVWAYHSRPSGLPLILAALPQYHAVFRHVSHNPRLLDKGLELHPDRLDAERLREEAWRVFEPTYRARVATAVNRYRTARSRQAGSDDLEDVVGAAVSGRVNTLLVGADRHVPGRIDPVDGRVRLGRLSDPDTDDVLDDVAERVLKTGGQVYVIPTDQMPSPNGVAAVYRF